MTTTTQERTAAPAQPHTRTMTMREALNLSLVHALERDPRVFLIGEDIADPMGGSFKITDGLSTTFGANRVRNTPISEAAIVGAAVGAALAGQRPIAEIMYVDFTAVAMDQIVNQAGLVSYMSGGQVSVPLVIRTQGGAWRSSAAQHAKSLESWFAHVPGLTYVVPANANDAYWLLQWAIEDPNPVIVFEPNLLYNVKSEVDLAHPPMDLLEPAVLREGTDATIVTWGYMSGMVLEAAERLAAEGISVEVLAMRRLAPLLTARIVDSVRRTGLLAVAHEAWTTGGLGAEIAARVADEAFAYLDGPIRRIGALDCPHPFAPQLERAMLPSVDAVVTNVRGWFDRSSRDA